MKRLNESRTSRQLANRAATRRHLRVGAATIEVIIATAITLPAVSYLCVMGWRAARNLYHVIATCVGWPLL